MSMLTKSLFVSGIVLSAAAAPAAVVVIQVENGLEQLVTFRVAETVSRTKVLAAPEIRITTTKDDKGAAYGPRAGAPIGPGESVYLTLTVPSKRTMPSERVAFLEFNGSNGSILGNSMVEFRWWVPVRPAEPRRSISLRFTDDEISDGTRYANVTEVSPGLFRIVPLEPSPTARRGGAAAGRP
jgi:hypothetical protein